MAPLPPSNTPRFKVFYTNCGRQHTMQFRSHLSPAALGTLVDGFFDTVTASVTATSIDEVQFAADGSDIFNAVTTGIEGNTYGTGAGSPAEGATFWSWIGRSSDGRRLRLYLFGTVGMAQDYRWMAGEAAVLDAARDYLAAAGDDIVTIGDLAPVWKTYINAGVNAHLQQVIRP
jgi:hypothetical protein